MTSKVEMLDELLKRLDYEHDPIEAEAAAAIRSLRKDARRYQWVRTHPLATRDPDINLYLMGEKLDAAIDAALQADKGER